MAERLRLYYPVRPYTVNQSFGENIPCVKDFGLPTQFIVDGADNTTCYPGFEKLYPKFGMSGHNGLDLKAGEQNVYAAHAGTVVEKQSVPARGLGVGILTDNQVFLDGAGVHFAKTRYWHLKSIFVEAGEHVEAGQLIGVTDTTGFSAGNHLHFEVQPIDKDAGGHPFLALPNNGIGAAIDPEPFFTGVYADTIPQTISLTRMLIIVLTKLRDELQKRKAS